MSYASHGETVSLGVKSHVLYSRLLSHDDYWLLLSSGSVGEIVDKLKNTAYADSMMTLPLEPHRNDLESAVKTSLIAKAEDLLVHLSEPRKSFFRAWMASYEAENLKSIFRHIEAHRGDRDELRRRLYELKASRVQYDNLLSARDFSEVADVMRTTAYYKVLGEPFKRLTTGEDKDLFPLEMALDTFVETSLYKALKKLEKSEYSILAPLLGTRVDLLNIYTLYRALAFYNLTPEETLNRLLPIRYKIPLSFLREVVRFNTPEQMIELMETRFPTYAKILAGALQNEEPELTLERNIRRFQYLEAQRIFSRGTPGFHTVISYFIIREYEIGDIIRMTEDVRYGYDRRQAAAYLVRPIISSGGDS